MTRENRPAWAVGGLVAVLIIAAVLVVLKTGSGGKGSIELHISEAGSRVFFENKEKTTTSVDSQTFTARNLRSKNYSLIVAKDGFWPWVKNIDIKNSAAVTLSSWSLPKIVKQEEVLSDDENYSEILSQINNGILAGEGNALVSSDSNFKVWVDKNTIFAEWAGEKTETPYYFCDSGECDSRIVVLDSASNIYSLSFFKNREDVLVFANSEGVYAIEINRAGTQNFQPILRTNGETRFYTEDGATFFILQNGSLLKANL